LKQIETEGLATFRKTRWFCSLVVAFAGIAMPSSAVLAVPTAPLQFSGISIPVSPFSPWISGINNSGQIVGSYLATDSTWHGFIDKLSSNEQFDPSTFAEIITPGPWDPFPEESIMGFNDLGQITGLYHDPLTGSARAYVASLESTTDVPEPSTLLLFGAGIIGIAAMRRRRRQGIGCSV
jgi:hypothetical protein